MNPEVICKVPRRFHRKVNCSFTTGKVTLSLTSFYMLINLFILFLRQHPMLQNVDTFLMQRISRISMPIFLGKSWSTALILSITLGGFGADRFYLGYWREGLGKLFSYVLFRYQLGELLLLRAASSKRHITLKFETFLMLLEISPTRLEICFSYSCNKILQVWRFRSLDDS